MVEIHIVEVDNRSGFFRDEYYPKLIFLFSVLRWCVRGNVCASEASKKTEIIRKNNLSLDSTSAFLADHIESGNIPVINVHSLLPVGSAEQKHVIEKLRSMDGGTVGGLIDEAGLNYYLDGKALFRIVMNATPQISDGLPKGGVRSRLAWDVPKEWHDEFNCIQTASADQQNKSTAECLADPPATEASDSPEMRTPPTSQLLTPVEPRTTAQQDEESKRHQPGKHQQQEEAILSAIRDEGFDPKKIPNWNPGTPGLKADVQASFVIPGPIFQSIVTLSARV